MPPREPMWYCHECNAEMRPLMTPDPQCASCHGTFVEKLDNPEDDPRAAHASGNYWGVDLGVGDETGPLQPETLGLFASLADILRSTNASPTGRSTGGRRASDPDPSNRASSMSSRGSTGTFRLEFGGSNGLRRTIVIGGDNVLGRRDSEQDVPPMSESSRESNSSIGSEGSNASTNSIPGNLMAQYLISMLGAGMRGGPMMIPTPFGMMGGESGGPTDGRWGDYVFSQDALDQIITQIMEAGNTSRPVPAPDDMIAKLPRDVLEESSPLLGEDCAVCKEQFSTSADPDDQIVLTLPCKHVFHVNCIEPWLKSSGTCPVCRYALVAQPTQQPGAGGAGAGSSSSSPSSPPPAPSSSQSPGGAGSGAPWPAYNSDSDRGTNQGNDIGSAASSIINLLSSLGSQPQSTNTTATTTTTTMSPPGSPTRSNTTNASTTNTTPSHSHSQSRSRSPGSTRERRGQHNRTRSGSGEGERGGGSMGQLAHNIMDRIHSLLSHDSSSSAAAAGNSDGNAGGSGGSPASNTSSSQGASESSPRRRGSRSPRGSDGLPGGWD